MGLKFFLVLCGVAFLMWGNINKPIEPEPFTWQGLIVKTVFILFFYILISVIALLFPEL